MGWEFQYKYLRGVDTLLARNRTVIDLRHGLRASGRRADARLLSRHGTKPVKQQERLAALIAYAIFLILLSVALFRTPLPLGGVEGLWLYFGFAALLLGEYLVEPFFSRPADAIANAVTLFISTATASQAGAPVGDAAFVLGQRSLMFYAVVVLLLSVIAISGKDTTGRWQAIASWATVVVSAFGRAKWMFSAAFFASVWAAFADSPSVVAVLYLSWFVIVAVQPAEWVFRRLRHRPTPMGRAELIRLQDPGIAAFRLPAGSLVELGERVTIGGRVRGTIVDLTKISERPVVRISLDEPFALQGTRFSVDVSGERSSMVIGYVDAGSDLETIRIRSVPSAAHVGLGEGRLVSVAIGEARALYQIITAEVAQRAEGDLARHLVLVDARKLGRWNEEDTAFQTIEWIPEPGTPVHLIHSETAAHDPYAFVGHVPGTRYGIAVDPHLIVTHNTALLGILGSGKTHVAWELIWRMLAAGIRVLVLDITGKYSPHFSKVYPDTLEQSMTDRINTAIAGDLQETEVRDNQAGNYIAFKRELASILDWFLTSGSQLLILNPNSFVASRMEGKPFGRHAQTLSEITMVDVTRLVAEHLLGHAQKASDQPEEGEARLCLVLEEAHSLVPEWGSAVNDSDKQAVNGTVRAILQGRKYGYGTLLVTQRTANVTKSILNQCNTVFGMRAFDATGMGFLENYVGPSYARLLASLKDRQAVVYGRGSSCRAPLLVRMNDAPDFSKAFLSRHLKDIAVTPSLPDAVTDKEGADDELAF